LNQVVATEPGRCGIGVLRGKFVRAQILVWQLNQNLELDRHEIVTADPLRPARGDESFDSGELVTPECGSGLGKNLFGSIDGFGCGYSWRRLRRHHGNCAKCCNYATTDGTGMRGIQRDGASTAE
jgi:hypothetical protein